MEPFLEQVIGGVGIDLSEVAGYSDEELSKIERLYDVKLTGDLRAFLSKMGRCDGGLLGDDPIFLYRSRISVRGHIETQMILFELMRGDENCGLLNCKPFLFSIENETQYYFVLTSADDPDAVYHYDENANRFARTRWTFGAYILHLARQPGHRRGIICRGELLNIPSTLGADVIQPTGSFFDKIGCNLDKGRARLTGYTHDEIAKIEQLYRMRIDGDLRVFLYEMGRCSRGALACNSLIFYKPSYSVRDHVLLQMGFINLLKDAAQFSLIKSKPFAFSVDKNDTYFYLLTDSEARECVYCFDRRTGEIVDCRISFVEYMHSLVEREAELYNNSCRGELIIV
jgi:hypothetical protein